MNTVEQIRVKDGISNALGCNHHRILVAQAQAIGAIAVIRSLGRAGYCVHAMSELHSALGLRSNFAAASALHPKFSSTEFLDWLVNYVDSHGICAIVPSEALLLAIRPRYAEFSSLMPIYVDEAVLYRCFSKTRLHDQLISSSHKLVRQNIPPTITINTASNVPNAYDLSDLALPVFVKADAVDALSTSARRSSIVDRCETKEEAILRINTLIQTYSRLMAQGFVFGIGVGVYFYRRNGNVVSEYMNLCIHENPHTGGMCSLRRTWFHQQIRDDALRKIEAIDWDGIAMMEYKWNPISDEFFFIEMNARFWAALHLAICAGVDFPLMLMEDFLAGEVRPRKYTVPRCVTCRLTVPDEIGYVMSKVRDPNVLTTAKLRSILGFFARFFSIATYSDLYFPGDRSLYWAAWSRFLNDLFVSCGRRCKKFLTRTK